MEIMEIKDSQISPVNMENRRKLGIRSGDTVRVWVKIQEKGKTRLQAFEGLVLSRKHRDEPGATFTVRKVSLGVGVERIFPLYSPIIDKIEIVKRSTVRKSKLYYIREKVAREVKRQMRRMKMMGISSVSDTAEAARLEKEEQEAQQKAEESAKEAERLKAEQEAKAQEEAKASEESSEETFKENTEEAQEEIKEEVVESAEEKKEEVK